MLPILYQSHDLVLYSYPLLMGIGWGVAYQIFFGLIDPSYPRLRAQLLFWGLFLFAWIGSKLLFLLTVNQSTDHLLVNSNFWLGGGFVFYGGFLAGVLFLMVYRMIDKKLSVELLWPMLPALAIGHGIGRLGCFLAGCCYGKPTDFFWGVYLHGDHRHPTQLIEAISLIGFGTFLIKSKSPRKKLLSQYLLFYGILRWIIELLRADSIRGQWGPMTPSQWISVALVLGGLGILSQVKAKT